VTDETGGYLLTNLPTGPYRLEAALQGFRSYVQTGIVLQVGGTPTVNPVLSVGSVEESVTVEAAAPLVDVRSAGISTVVNNEDIYGPGKDATDLKPGQQIDNYFNRAAFAQASPGKLGNATRNLAVGPAFWQIDLAISRLVPVGTQQVEMLFESFNVLNHFNWGNPVTNFNSGAFGRITTQAGDPRILQFGVKYAF
jgi:hypothetical protein